MEVLEFSRIVLLSCVSSFQKSSPIKSIISVIPLDAELVAAELYSDEVAVVSAYGWMSENLIPVSNAGGSSEIGVEQRGNIDGCNLSESLTDVFFDFDLRTFDVDFVDNDASSCSSLYLESRQKNFQYLFNFL